MACIKIKGLAQLTAKLDKFAKQKYLVQAIGQGAAVMQREAKQLVPVDKGALRNSITVLPTVERADMVQSGIVTALEYAAYVEFGTGVRGAASNHPKNGELGVTFREDWNGQIAQPFMYPAAQNSKDKVNKLVAGAIMQAAKEIAL